MGYRLIAEEENPLWRNYMDSNKSEEDLQEVTILTPFPSKTISTYSENEFLEKLRTDKPFNLRWGRLQ